MKKSCGPIFAKDLKNMIQKFKEVDSFELKSGRGGKLIEDVATALEKGASNGVQYAMYRELANL